MNRLVLLTLFLSTAGGFLCGQTVYRAAKIQATPTQFFQPGEILVEKGKIRAIGKSVKVPKKAKVVEWKDLEIYAGLISPGSSLGLTEINALRPTRDEREVGTHTPDVEAWVAVNPDSELIPVARANGVTHSIIAPMGGMISGTSGLITLDGWGIEEMTIRKKVALHLWWPGHSLGLPQPHAPGQPAPKSMEEQERERKERIREIDEFFDQAEAYRKGKEAHPDKLVQNPAWDAMKPVLEGKIPLMIHADETRQIKAAVEWAEERKYRMILSGGQDAWKLADWLGEREIPVVYLHMFTAPRYRNSPHDEQFRAGNFGQGRCPPFDRLSPRRMDRGQPFLGTKTFEGESTIDFDSKSYLITPPMQSLTVCRGKKPWPPSQSNRQNSPEYPSVSALLKSGRKQLSSPPRGTCSTFAPPSNTWSLPGKKQACKAGTPVYTKNTVIGPLLAPEVFLFL